MSYRRKTVFRRFYPDYKFANVQEIPDSFFTENGIEFAVLDIDNTLVPYTSPLPTGSARGFIARLKALGIRSCFVSNNGEERVKLFCTDLGESEYIWKARKPLAHKIKRAMKKMGADKSNTVLIGDQVFTDILGAKQAGIKAVMVDPIEAKETPFFGFKRAMERVVLKNYNP